MDISAAGVKFISRHEGFVSKAYKDPVGVVTIGHGFTNSSRVARKMLGKIEMGDSITMEQSLHVLRACIEDEYGPPVEKKITTGLDQHEYDGSASVCFNLGPGALNWKWAAALAAGNVAEAARLLRQTGTTAKGKKLRGLVTRRREEAALIERADYGVHGQPSFSPGQPAPTHPEAIDTLREAQAALKELGLYKGKVDGRWGPISEEAVLAFQLQHPTLKDDGVLGRATYAQLDRVMDLRKKAATQPGVGAAVGGGSGAAGSVSAGGSETVLDVALWGTVGAVAVALVVLLFLAWRYKDEIRLAMRRG